MLEFLFALLLKAKPSIPPPPYRLIGSLPVSQDEYSCHYAVYGDRLYASSGLCCVAVDLKHFRPLWTTQISETGWAEEFVERNGIVYVSSLENLQGRSRLVALNARNGEIAWRRVYHGGSSAMAVSERAIYVVVAPNRIGALDLKTLKPYWEAQLPGREDLTGCRSLKVSDSVVLVNYGSQTTALDERTGRRLWTEANSVHLRNSLVISNGVAWMSSQKGSVARQATSGKLLWRSPFGLRDFGACSDGKFLGLSSNQIFCLEARTGRPLWQTPRPRYLSSEPASLVGGCVFGLRSAISASGQTLWVFSADDDIGLPCWTDGQVMTAFDSGRLLRYEHGARLPIPTNSALRQREANQLVAHFEELDAQERKRLVLLADESVEPLVKLYLRACVAYEAAPGLSSSRQLGVIFKMLERVCQRRHTELLISYLMPLPRKDTRFRELFRILAKVGEPELTLDFFLRECDLNKDQPPLAYEFLASEYISQSTRPEAIQFMLRQLDHPDSKFHAQAYFCLAGVAGEEGARAVLALARRRSLLRPLGRRLERGQRDSGEWANRADYSLQGTDPKGRQWALVSSGLFGSKRDLWLVQRIGEGWSRPVLTNLNASPSESWLETLPDNPALFLDGDGDNLTDLEEARLGTDPARPDTDGDGDPDEVDPWPNVANRLPGSEAERALAAAFEANFHFDRGEAAALFIAPPDLPPLELAGYCGPMLWTTDEQPECALLGCYPQGVGVHRLERIGPKQARSWQEKFIQWSADGREARFRIVSAYGRLNASANDVTVRLVGGRWVVVAAHLAWVS
ncbi:MAG: PQQ-binding-like beta-propeller repeat protein [Vulcanimicrobiota bacterium]